MDLPAPTPTHQAITFEERGVSAPFTTPTLAGARVRRDGRHSLVLVVPNPAGGRGVYVLPWHGVRDMCQPTLHDNMLHDAIAQSADRVIAPPTVRDAARRVAVEGAAGRAAQVAAMAAMQAERVSRQATNSHLLYALATRPHLQSTLTEIAAIAAAIDEIGVGSAAAHASIPLRLHQLRALRESMASFSHLGSDEAGYVGMAVNMADLCIRCAEQVLADSRRNVADIERLLMDWRTRPADVTAMVGRTAWVIDGWSLPCLLWVNATGRAARRTALAEIGHIMTALPREAGAWIDASTAAEVGQVARRMVGLNQDWRTGLSPIDLVARNEHFRAMAA